MYVLINNDIRQTGTYDSFVDNTTEDSYMFRNFIIGIFHIILNKARRMREVEHVTCMEKYVMLARKSRWRPRCRWKDDIKLYLQEIA
jgi:hypothetical protein